MTHFWDKILKCDHSNENSGRAVLSCGAVYYALQNGSNSQWVKSPRVTVRRALSWPPDRVFHKLSANQGVRIWLIVTPPCKVGSFVSCRKQFEVSFSCAVLLLMINVVMILSKFAVEITRLLLVISTATLTILWHNSSLIRGKTHENLTSIC